MSDTSEEIKDKDSPSLSKEDLLKVAKQRFQLAVEAEADNRRDEVDDIRFMVGEQWPQDIKNQRLTDSRPCLTLNRIPQFVRQITNDQRQNRPSIKINPVDDKATIEVAKIYQGVIRHIEYSSHADIAYDTAFDGAVETGLGYWRIVTEYADPMSFQQEIRIKRIKDRFSVYIDPFHQEPDGSDAEWCFVFEDMSKDEFKERFPDSDLSSMADWESLGMAAQDWVKKDSVRIAEYFYKTYEMVDLVRLSDGRIAKKSDLPEQLEEGVKIVSERKARVATVNWCKLNGIEVLEETIVPGEWIPVIPVVGEEHVIEGRKVINGITRHAKDAQRMYNFFASAETEAIALAPKAPFIGAEGQFEGYEQDWKTANTKNHAFLQYKLKSINGQPAPPPQRQTFEPAVQAISQARQSYGEELKANTGIYDAPLGRQGNEMSGVAIQRRVAQANATNFHFTDNLARSLRHTGRILINWIPKVYDTAQAIRVIGEDGEIDTVQINQAISEGKEQGTSYHLDVGSYDVTVDTGPSYQTKRQEAVASMLDLTRVAPGIMQLAGDLLIRSMDWPHSQEIADRLKKRLPPDLTDDGKSQKQIPPEVQQQMSHMNQMVQTLSQQNAELMEMIKTKKVELDSKERIAASEQKTQIAIEWMKHHAKDSQLEFQAALAQADKFFDQASQDQSQNQQAQGPQGPPPSNMQQPTGGFSPGQNLGANP